MAKKPSDPVKLNLRFTEGLRSQLEKQALKNNRSLNAEIVGRLEQSFEQADRIAFFREAMEKRIEDHRQRMLEEVATSRKEAEKEALAGYKQAHQDMERQLERHNAEFERKIAEATRAAAVIDVLLGGQLKSEFFRSLALELANVSEDWLADEANRRELVEQAVAAMKRRPGVAAR